MNGRRLLPLLVTFWLLTIGCGSFIKGSLLVPSAIAEDQAASLVESTGIPAEVFPVSQPVTARVYPTGELIIDVLVMVSAVEPSWSNRPGDGKSESDSVMEATFHTNGLNVPAKLTSNGREDGRILIRDAHEDPIEATRAVLGVAPFEENREGLHATDNFFHNVRVITFRRAGKPCRACFVPVLLSTDRPVQAGETIDVRIKPRDRHEYDVDDRWYRLVVQAFDPAGADKAQ
jgi:hypothetical protein